MAVIHALPSSHPGASIHGTGGCTGRTGPAPSVDFPEEAGKAREWEGGAPGHVIGCGAWPPAKRHGMDWVPVALGTLCGSGSGSGSGSGRGPPAGGRRATDGT